LNKSNLYAVLTYKEFYGTRFSGEDALSAIARFDFEDIILALILILNDSAGRLENEVDVSGTFMRRLPRPKALRLNHYVTRNESEKFMLTNNTVIAKIITDLFQILPQGSGLLPAADISFEETLLDVVLIYNERQYPEVGLGLQINTHELIWRLMLMQDITGLTNIHYARTSNIKYMVFIQFLKEILGNSFVGLESDFKMKTGVDGLYVLALTLITLYVKIEEKFKEPGNPIVLIEKNESLYAFLKSFDLVFDKTAATGRTADVGFYVTHPFFEHSDGRIYLIDHTQFAFALDRGWFYCLFANSDIKDRITGVKNFSDFQGFLGKQYYEKYLITGLLKTVNRTGFRIIETDDKHLSDITVVLNEKDIFFIEIKSSALHYKVIDEKQVDLFKKFIDDNFASLKKGAGQLFKNIQYFAKDISTELNLKTPKSKLTIYPVIIYTEQHLEKYAVNDYVNQKFSALTNTFQNPFQEIKPLVMVHYDFFVENISLLNSQPSIFKKSINAYIAHWKKKKAAYHKSEHNMDYLTSMVSFDKFIVGFEKLYMLEQGFIFRNISKIFKLKE
jgi:hypothetical protein